MRALAVLVVFALAACKGDGLQWKKHEIKQVQLGDFTLAVPKGWRDLRESEDSSLARLHTRLGADTEAHIFVRENASNTDSNIALMWSDLVGVPTCDQFSRAMGGGIEKQTVLEQPYGADRGCSFWMKQDDSEGKTFVRFHPPKMLTLQCLRPAKGDDAADATCESVAAALAAQ